jgi:hypothetical protein
MVAPPEVPRNAERAQSKGRVVLPGRVEQRGQQHTHYKGRDTPAKLGYPAPTAQETLAGDHALQWVLCVVYADTRSRTGGLAPCQELRPRHRVVEV